MASSPTTKPAKASNPEPLPRQLTSQFELLPGDVLLYRPASIYGWLIRVKTWHRISHVELYVGNGQSSASRDGLGVSLYPLRLAQLAYVLRPTTPFDAARAIKFTERYRGTPYGWLELLNFIGLPINIKGIVCSPWVTEVLRDAGVPIFDSEPANLIAPFQFKTSELLEQVWSDGESE